MVKVISKNLPVVLAACTTEEEVKSEFAKAFGLKMDTRKRIDLYTNRILFEFKHNRQLLNLDARSQVLAQTMYYIRNIKFGKSDLVIPPYICVVDKNQALIVETHKFKKIVNSTESNFDWDRAPSTPCPNVIKATKVIEETKNTHIYDFTIPEDFQNFCALIHKYQVEQLTIEFIKNEEKKEITEKNFDMAYSLWLELFGGYVENGRKASEYFLTDIQIGKSQILSDSHEVAFDIGANQLIRKPMPMDKYNYYWNTYNRCSDPRVTHAIHQRVDRLSVEDFRRFTGEFYTPSEKWWESGYRLWDMAAGTGNLEYSIPEEALPYCYISTLLEDDAKYCQQLYPEATVFQYDYLNDDVNLFHNSGLDLYQTGVNPKLPKKLFDELNDPKIKWVIFINPPFATSNVGSRQSDVNKDSVSMTEVRKLMGEENLGETSRELFSQFLWRVSRDFMDKEAHLGMFSKIKYINANNDQKMRESFFKYKFERGFCFPAKSFHGNKGNFPVGFLVWNLNKSIPLNEQSIVLDVFNEFVEKEGIKEVPSVDRSEALSKWVDRPANSKILPPLTNAISVADAHVDVRDRVAEGFLCSLMAKGNDFANQNFTALLSGPYVSAGAFSVIPENFTDSLVMHAVRRIPKATWLNDRDQWMQPTVEKLDPEFIADCVVWSLFSNSNATSSLSDIKYKGEIYQLNNELFPFLIADIEKWECSLSSIKESLLGKQKDRYAAIWLQDHKLSTQASKVLERARIVYGTFFKVSASLPWPQYKIKRWDAGWYQIRRSLSDAQLDPIHLEQLSDVSFENDKLGAILLPQIREFGFIQGSEYIFGEDIP